MSSQPTHVPRLCASTAWGLSLGLGLSLWPACSAVPSTPSTHPANPWATVPQILERIVPPAFPSQVFDVTGTGAIGDGHTDCTAAIRAAVELCHDAGGGRVLVPAGRYRTGPVHLQDNVEFHLAEGAELIFSDNPEDYLPVVFVRVGGVELYNYSPLIYARGRTNIAVTGKGRLNGNAKAWWEWAGHETRAGFAMGAKGVPVEKRVFGKPEDAIRPSFLCLVSCTNVLLEDFTIGSGPNWTIHPVYCQNITIRGVKVMTDGPNNDGIDPDSCRDMLIENCTFDTGDDCVVLKSGYNEDGWRVGRPTENVIMRDCTSKRGHGGLVIGSEMSGDVRNVFMENCVFEGTDRAIRIKSRADRGGVVENIFARSLKVKDMQREVIILNMDYGADRNQVTVPRPPLFRNMRFENITADGAPTAVRIQGMPESPVQQIQFANMMLRTSRGVVAKHIRRLLFQDLRMTLSEGPVFDCLDAAGTTFRRVIVPEGTDVFLRLEGNPSGELSIESCNLSAVKTPVVTDPGVDPGTVTVEDGDR